MFQITVEGQKQDRFYECEDIATLVYSHLTLLYPTLNIKLYEEVYYEAYNILKENNPIVRYENPFKTYVWLGITRLESSAEFNNRSSKTTKRKRKRKKNGNSSNIQLIGSGK